MIKEAIEKIEALAVQASGGVDPFLVVGGRLFWRDRSPIVEASANTLHVHSLRGVVDYLRGVDKEPLDNIDRGIAIHVVGPRVVALLSEEFGAHRQRDTYVHAVPADGDGFPFGMYMSSERMVIALGSQFAPGGDLADVVDVVSHLRAEKVKTADDDGFAQKVATRAGIERTQETTIKAPVTLYPHRTFADIAQPAGQFILRASGGGDGELPKVALHEVNDGQWRRKAIDGIRGYFAEHLPEVPVIG